MRLIIISLFFLSTLFASEAVSAARYARLVSKGEHIAQKLCDPDKLPSVDDLNTTEAIIAALKKSGACPPLSRGKMEALATFLKAGGVRRHSRGTRKIVVPPGAKCPVCGMFVSKYPKWAAEMIVAGKKHYFDGVKDLMKYYFFDGDFPYDRSKIEAMLVADFYTLEALPARSAYYVLGSKLYGPMGNELIPFKSEREAKDFIADHGGDRIVRFDQITPKMVMALDGIDYDQ